MWQMLRLLLPWLDNVFNLTVCIVIVNVHPDEMQSTCYWYRLILNTYDDTIYMDLICEESIWI